MAACSRTAQTAVDQSVPTHCKSHTPQVGTGEREACRGQFPAASAILLGGHQQSRTRTKAPQVEMGTPLIKLHRWSTLVGDY